MLEQFKPKQFDSWNKVPEEEKSRFNESDGSYIYTEALSKDKAEIEAEKYKDKIKNGEARGYNEASNLIEKESLFKKIEKALAQDTPRDHTTSKSLDVILMNIGDVFPITESEELKKSIIGLLKKYEDYPKAGALIALALEENAKGNNKNLELIKCAIAIFSDPLAQEIIKKFESTGRGDEGCQISRIGELSIYHKEKSIKLLPFYYKAMLNYIDAPWMGEYIGRAVDYVSSKSAQTKLEIYAKSENAQQIKEAIRELDSHYLFRNKIDALLEKEPSYYRHEDVQKLKIKLHVEQGIDDAALNLIDKEYKKLKERIRDTKTINELKLVAENIGIFSSVCNYLLSPDANRGELGKYMKKLDDDLQNLIGIKIKQNYLDIEIEPKNEIKIINFLSSFGINSIRFDWGHWENGQVEIKEGRLTDIISKDKVMHVIINRICLSEDPFDKVISKLEEENKIDLRPYS